MRFRKLQFNPARNPGVLATGTWDRAAAWRQVQRMHIVPPGNAGSRVQRGAATFQLACLPDGQRVFIEMGHGGAALGEPLGEVRLGNGGRLAVYPTDAAVVDRYCRILEPMNRPRALGATPRLGIGTRMTAAVWPGVFAAMTGRGFAANTIQNSVRELNFLDDLLAARPSPTNYACGFGTIETGYTGSSWEGLWVAGVLAALGHDQPLRYGADADHLQVKRGPEGMARARRWCEAARYYSFYTLDMADILNYGALAAPPAQAADLMRRRIRSRQERRLVAAYHHRLSAEAVGRYVGKYWGALAALTDLCGTISRLKGGAAFDLEFTIDEHPPEVAAFDCLTTPDELRFVLGEIRRRGLPVTHVAPNLGQEKGWDYRCPDGLPGLEKRLRRQFAVAEEFGVMLDVHSADDLTRPVRRVIRRATGGRVHYKISPMLQLLFAEALAEHRPALFRRWWADALAYARREAEAGSAFAAECVRAYERQADGRPSPNHMVFHHYSFAYVGRRDARGQFLHREEFYSLPQGFYREYERRVAGYVGNLAADLFRAGRGRPGSRKRSDEVCGAGPTSGRTEQGEVPASPGSGMTTVQGKGKKYADIPR